MSCLPLKVSEFHTLYGLGRTTAVSTFHDSRILMGDETHWGLKSFLGSVKDCGGAVALAQVGVEVEDCWSTVHYTNSVLQSERRFDANVLVGSTQMPVALFSAERNLQLPLYEFENYHVKGRDNFTSSELCDALEVTTGQAAYSFKLPTLMEDHGDPEFYILASLLGSPEVIWNLIVEGHDGYQYDVDNLHYIRRVVIDIHSNQPLNENGATKLTRIARDTDAHPLVRDLLQPIYEESNIVLDPGFHIATRFSSEQFQPEVKGANMSDITNTSTNRQWAMKSGVLTSRY